MPSKQSQTSDRDPLQTLLKKAEDELRTRLHAACEAEANGVSTETTAKIRRLEDDLLAAALAAKQALAVRSHIERESDPPPAKTASAAEDSGDRQVMGVREFTDDAGKPWRAWSVVPAQSKTSTTGTGVLGDFQSGWICFESLGSSARRRLPFPRAKWPSITDEELRGLLATAIDAPIRVKKGPGVPAEH